MRQKFKGIAKACAIVALGFAIIAPNFAYASSSSSAPLSYELFDTKASVKEANGGRVPNLKPENVLSDGTQGGYQADISIGLDGIKYEDSINKENYLPIQKYQDGMYRAQNGDILVRLLMLPILSDQNLNIGASGVNSVIMPVIKHFVELLFGLVAFVVFFNIVAGAVKTATSGKFLGGEFKLSTQLFRLIFSFVSLVPIGNTVAIVYFVVWLSTQGIYMADALNDEYQETFGVKVEKQPFRYTDSFEKLLKQDIVKIAKRRACVLQLQASNFKNSNAERTAPNSWTTGAERNMQYDYDLRASRMEQALSKKNFEKFDKNKKDNDYETALKYYFGIRPIQYAREFLTGKDSSTGKNKDTTSVDLNKFNGSTDLYSQFFGTVKSYENIDKLAIFMNEMAGGSSFSDAKKSVDELEKGREYSLAALRKINKLPFFYEYGGFINGNNKKDQGSVNHRDLLKDACGSITMTYGDGDLLNIETQNRLSGNPSDADDIKQNIDKSDEKYADKNDKERTLINLVKTFVAPDLLKNTMTNTANAELLKLKQLMLMNDLLGGSMEEGVKITANGTDSETRDLKHRILKPVGRFSSPTEHWAKFSTTNANKEMQEAMNGLVYRLAFGNGDSSRLDITYVNKIANNYIAQLESTYANALKTSDTFSEVKARKENGFVTLGLYYWSSIYNGAVLSNTVNELPTLKFDDNGLLDYNTSETAKDLKKFTMVGANADVGSLIGLLNYATSGLIADHCDFISGEKCNKGGLTKNGVGSTFDLINDLKRSYDDSPMNPAQLTKIFMNANPMITIVDFGKNIVQWSINTAMQMATTSYVAPPTSADGNTGNYGALSVMIIMFCTGLLVMGLTMMIYVPLLPFIIWFGAIVGYIVTFFEGLVATPVWAFAHVFPEKNGFVGKQSQGYMLLFALLIKPALMVFGFVASIQLLYPIGYLLNMMMLIVLWTILANVSGILWLFTFTVTVFIYFAFLQNVVKKLFGLVHIIPDQVMKYVGNSSVANLGDYANQIEQGTQQSAERVSQAGVSAASLASHRLGQNGDQTKSLATNFAKESQPAGASATPQHVPSFGSGFSNAQRNASTLYSGGNGGNTQSEGTKQVNVGTAGESKDISKEDNAPPIVAKGLNNRGRTEATLNSKQDSNTQVAQDSNTQITQDGNTQNPQEIIHSDIPKSHINEGKGESKMGPLNQGTVLNDSNKSLAQQAYEQKQGLGKNKKGKK